MIRIGREGEAMNDDRLIFFARVGVVFSAATFQSDALWAILRGLDAPNMAVIPLSAAWFVVFGLFAWELVNGRVP